jgi:DNA-binding IclR family transcriptional regulator
LLPDATPDVLDSLIAMTRQRGFARIDGLFIPGLAAVAAPVLDWQGQAQAVLTLITTDPVALADTAPALKLLAETCRTLSLRGAASAS